jgi:hypothetical protein
VEPLDAIDTPPNCIVPMMELIIPTFLFILFKIHPTILEKINPEKINTPKIGIRIKNSVGL